MFAISTTWTALLLPNSLGDQAIAIGSEGSHKLSGLAYDNRMYGLLSYDNLMKVRE